MPFCAFYTLFDDGLTLKLKYIGIPEIKNGTKVLPIRVALNNEKFGTS